MKTLYILLAAVLLSGCLPLVAVSFPITVTLVNSQVSVDTSVEADVELAP